MRYIIIVIFSGCSAFCLLPLERYNAFLKYQKEKKIFEKKRQENLKERLAYLKGIRHKKISSAREKNLF